MFRSFRCASCRQELFDETVLGTHVQKKECRSWFVEEPLAWMRCEGGSGKLSCPKCQRKIGNFDWSGIKCSCGEWVAPAFQIGAKHVDAKIVKARKTVDAVVPIHWLKTAPPPCVVVVAGGEGVRRQIESLWLNRHVKEGRAAWIYPSLDQDLDDVIDTITHKGVESENIAVGAIGNFAHSRKAMLTFALGLAPNDPSLTLLTEASHRQQILAIFAERIPAEVGRLSSVSTRAFPRLRPGELDAGVVRTLVLWLHEHLPGHASHSSEEAIVH